MDVSAANLLALTTKLYVIIERLPADLTSNGAVAITIRGAEGRPVITLIGSKATGSPAHPFSGGNLPY